ncbi:glyoxylase-like metal-dependent hydrolase (beta-lactamase superfamily II) [Salana multivorans]|uniref:Glyoxylase-like metal-dependent hydrolase (Beta-lactamase superfamily II) n=1 Tax=Salana multivorans TaxID=120377 RepID=A0A3N2D936_9MICO|nr:MBL fold metallo-hydrolase [Salana multivorans]ROR96138.1 glyoxylase-like metal-dependent hydrolase (beta-lactamase superfamily II) [Salana multivorans]
MSAVEVAPDIWLVGSCDPGSPAFTDRHDCAQYLLWRDGEGWLVDAGTGLGSDRWLGNVAEVADPAGLSGLVVTHYHADHAGGAAAALDRGLRVLASPVTGAALRVGDDEATSLARARTAGVYPPDLALAPAPTVEPAPATLPLAWGTLEVLDTPGHCDGHVAVLLTREGRSSLLAGDVVFAGGRIAIQAIADCRPLAYAETVAHLASRDVDDLLPGHGAVVLGGAGADLRRAAASFAALLPPPNHLPAPGYGL